MKNEESNFFRADFTNSCYENIYVFVARFHIAFEEFPHNWTNSHAAVSVKNSKIKISKIYENSVKFTSTQNNQRIRIMYIYIYKEKRFPDYFINNFFYTFKIPFSLLLYKINVIKHFQPHAWDFWISAETNVNNWWEARCEI